MNLLARFAECTFWLARYFERCENLARLLDVQETFSRDDLGSQSWLSVVQLNADEERFLERYPEATREQVLHFYVVDRENPTSIIANLAAARENARTLRPLISTEMWLQVNVFYNRMRDYASDPRRMPALPQLCSWIKEACQAHDGIVDGTLFRDQVWYFYQIGKFLERADNSTRILDTKYFVLLPSLDDVGTAVDAGQWNALLRSVAGYHAFRRVHPRGMQPEKVVDFLLFNPRFPRSVYRCLGVTSDLLGRLKSAHDLRGGNGALERLDELTVVLDSETAEQVISQGLHQFNDRLQTDLKTITTEIARDFFDQPPVDADQADVSKSMVADAVPVQKQASG